MSAKVDLYDSAYANYASEVYRQVRIETYGEDFGQTGRTTTEESREIPSRLDLNLTHQCLKWGAVLVDMPYTWRRPWVADWWAWILMSREFRTRTNLLPPEVSVKGSFRTVRPFPERASL